MALEIRGRENPLGGCSGAWDDGAVVGQRSAAPRGIAPLLTLSVVVLVVAFGASRGLWLANLHNGLLALACAGVGAYVLWQRPRHAVGTLLLATGLVEAVMYTGRQFGHGPDAGEHPWLVWLGVWPLAIALTLITLSVLCFPDGRLPSSHWRWVAWAVVVVGGVCAALSAVWPVEYEAAGVVGVHPISQAAPAAAADVWAALAHPAYIAFQVLWVVAVVARWRASGPLVRRQLAWLVAAAGLSVLALLSGLIIGGSPRAGVLAAVLVPVAAGIAIVRGQQLATYSALSWLSRSAPGGSDRPSELAAAAAQALTGERAVLWMGDEDRLHGIGVWPATDETPSPTTLEELEANTTEHVRAVLAGGELIGAVSVTASAPGALSRHEHRLLDDLTAQAALLLQHLDLAGVIARQRQADQLEELTARERDVLDLMARGYSNAAIGRELHLSVKTIEPLVSTIFAKLELGQDAASNRRVLAVLAYLQA
jgi:DNA-binding CsgD family transcriptional regulator